MQLDPLDRKIVELLRSDARLSYREIAERLGSTTPTVSARVKALEDIGLLRGYHAALGGSRAARATHVLTAQTRPQDTRAAYEALRAIEGVREALLLPGGRLVLRLSLRPPGSSLATFHEAIASIPGVLAYEASEVLDASEQEETADPGPDVDVPCHMCQGPIHGDPIRARIAERAHVFCCRHCLAGFRTRHEALAQKARTRQARKA